MKMMKAFLEEALQAIGSISNQNPKAVSMAYVSLLKECGKRKILSHLKAVHAHAIKNNFQRDVFVGSSLISMYAKAGSLGDARQVFDSLPVRDNITWNAIIAGYARLGKEKDALDLFLRMKRAGFQADRATFLLLLSVCGSVGNLDEGRRIHSEIAQSGWESHPFVATALMSMYAKCGRTAHARSIFDGIKERSVVTWTAMIAAYAKAGDGDLALVLWQQMQQENVNPNEVTFVCLLNACAAVGNLGKGKKIHVEIVKARLQSDVRIGNALIDMYSKCGNLGLACEVFDSMDERDVVTWTTLIAGHVKHRKFMDALTIFEEMILKGVNPMDMTFASVFNACGGLVALEKGKRYHAEAVDAGLKLDVFLADTLIDMYAKCGDLDRSRRVFDEMPLRDVVAWTSMIAGYSTLGQYLHAFQLFRQMQQENVRPNEVTFLSVLSSCAHLGLVEEGCCLFRSMGEVYALNPALVHHGCVIDLLCRAGCLDEANNFINGMSVSPDVSIWMTLLAACHVHGNIKLAEHAFKHILELEPQGLEAYVLLSNIYAAAGCWEKKIEVRRLMDARGARKHAEASLFL